jgi:phage I-like protein
VKISNLLFALIPAFAIAGDQKAQVAKLTDTQVMFTSDLIDEAQFSDCQPLKGESVVLGEMSQRSGALNLVRVRVTEGRCLNQEGWIGLARLESVDP